MGCRAVSTLARLGAALLLLGVGPVVAATPGPAPDEPPPAPRARLVLEAGWARLAEGGRERLLLPADGPSDLSGPYVLELSAGGRARLTLTGRGSLEFSGATRLEQTVPRGTPRLGLARLGRAEVELRGERIELELPQGQILRARQCAFSLVGRSQGAVDFHHRGGAPVELDLGGRYPFELASGQRLRLPLPQGRR